MRHAKRHKRVEGYKGLWALILLGSATAVLVDVALYLNTPTVLPIVFGLLAGILCLIALLGYHQAGPG